MSDRPQPRPVAGKESPTPILCAKHHGAAMRRRRPIEHIRVPLLCHHTNLPFVAVFMRSGRRMWFDHTAVTNQGRSPAGSAMDLDPPRVIEVFP